MDKQQICSILLQNAAENIGEEVVAFRLTSRLVYKLEEMDLKSEFDIEQAKDLNEQFRSSLRKFSQYCINSLTDDCLTPTGSNFYQEHYRSFVERKDKDSKQEEFNLDEQFE